MPVNDFYPVTPEGQVQASELRRLGDEVRAHDKITGSGPVGVRRDGAGFQVEVELPLVFWAKITGHTSGTPTPHSWTQQLENPDGTFSDDPEGRSGTTTVFPAYALDGSTASDGHIVRLYLGQGGEFFLFDPGMSGAAGSSLLVEQSDLTVFEAAVTTLFVDQVTGLAIESHSANTVTLHNRSASDTQAGVVSLGTQTLGTGDKRFSANVDMSSGQSLFWDDGSGASQGYILMQTTGAPTNSVVIAIPQIGPDLSTATLANFGSTATYFAVGQSTATRGNARYAVTDASGTILGITGTGLTSVDTVGGIVVGGSASSPTAFSVVDAITYAFSGGF